MVRPAVSGRGHRAAAGRGRAPARPMDGSAGCDAPRASEPVRAPCARERLDRVGRAGRQVAAGWCEQRREQELVVAPARRAAARSRPLPVAQATEKGRGSPSPRSRTSSTKGWREGRRSRHHHVVVTGPRRPRQARGAAASRSRRRARLRTTAPPILLRHRDADADLAGRGIAAWLHGLEQERRRARPSGRGAAAQVLAAALEAHDPRAGRGAVCSSRQALAPAAPGGRRSPGGPPRVAMRERNPCRRLRTSAARLVGALHGSEPCSDVMPARMGETRPAVQRQQKTVAPKTGASRPPLLRTKASAPASGVRAPRIPTVTASATFGPEAKLEMAGACPMDLRGRVPAEARNRGSAARSRRRCSACRGGQTTCPFGGLRQPPYSPNACFTPSMTNWTERAASRRPRRRESIRTSVGPSARPR